MTRPQISRRRFLASGAITAAPMFVPSRVLAGPGRAAANDRVRVGVIGCGVRGKYLIANLPASAQVAALCDCSLDRVGKTLDPRGTPFAGILASFHEADANGCRTHQDYRRMLDREKLDAVIIAAPDHHHVLAAMLACQAGLDVYLEKPLSVAVAEGRKLVEAVRRTGRVLQVGSQQRTMEMNRFACEFIRDGGLGGVSRVELPNYPGPLHDEALPEEPAPPSLDWSLFCGPTPLRPHNRKLWVKEEFHVGGLLWRGWDLWRDYSGHLMTNWGAHSVDMVQYALGMDDSGPVVIWPSDDVSEDVMEQDWSAKWSAKTPRPRGAWAGAARFRPIGMKYASGTELHFRPGVDEAVFYGERGVMRISRNKFQAEPPDLIIDPPDPRLAEKWRGEGHVARPHLENWLACLRPRQAPNAPVEAGHRTVTICHLANIARELGRRLRWDPVAEQFPGDEEANRLLHRGRRKGFDLPAI